MPVFTGVAAHGLPSLVELMTPDPSAVAAFYTGVFGWQVAGSVGVDGASSLSATIDGVRVAELGTPPDALVAAGAPPAWRVFFQIDDIDTAEERVVSAGGAVVAPLSEPAASRMLLCRDPVGALVGFRSAGDHDDPRVLGGPGALGWLELLAEDYENTFEFYEELAALTTSTVPMGDGQPAYTLFFATGNDVVAGAWPPDLPDTQPHWRVYFTVPDLQAALHRVEEHGGRCGAAGAGTGMGRWASVTDPAGAVFSVMEPERSGR